MIGLAVSVSKVASVWSSWSAGIMSLLLLFGTMAWSAEMTPETAGRILENLGVVAVPKGKDGLLIKKLLTSEGQPAMEGTVVAVRWDDRGMTFVFDCEDKQIKAGQRKRDDGEIWNDDTVEVFLDPGRQRDQAGTRWMHVIVSAAGVEYDEAGPMIYAKRTGDPIHADIRRNLPGLKTKTEKTTAGWRADIFIPWDALGGTPAVGDIWGFNLNRVNWTDGAGEFLCMSPTLGLFYNIDRWAPLAFFEKPANDSPVTLSAVLRDLHMQIVSKGGTGATSERFVTIQNAPVASEATTSTTRWDDQGLTITVDCEDSDVMSTPQKRDDIDNIWQKNDAVEVFLDVDNRRDPRSNRWMHLIVSADGSVADQRGPMEWDPKIHNPKTGTRMATPKGGDIKWDLAGLKARTEKTKTGWRAELFIPWAGLGAKKPEPFEAWGYNVTRNNWSKNNPSPVIQCMSPTFISFLTIARWGTVLFVEKSIDLPAAMTH